MKFLDIAGVSHLISEIKNKYVQKVTGKELSTNDFTNAYKAEVDKVVNKSDTSYVNEKVKTDVPVNAKFTDTVTSIDGKTGVIKKEDIVALGIPSKDTVTDITGKVDKVSGKGLSSNDYTATEKSKLNTIENNAQKNVIELIKRNGTNLAVGLSKDVDINVPVKYSDLTNDKTFQTKAEIITLINNNAKLKKEIVSALPDAASADDGTLYLLETAKGFSEWFAINGVWEKMGDTSDIDLTGYVKTSDISIITNAEIDAYINA